MSDLGELSLSSSGYGRIGQIEHYLQNYEQAAQARRQVIAIMHKALAVDPRHAGILSDAAYEYQQLGESLFELAQYEDAAWMLTKEVPSSPPD